MENNKSMKTIERDLLYKVPNFLLHPYMFQMTLEFIKKLLSKEQQTVTENKKEEYHRCKHCGAISSWDGCFCERKRGEKM